MTSLTKCCRCGRLRYAHYRYKEYPALVFCDPREEWENGEYGPDGAATFLPSLAKETHR